MANQFDVSTIVASNKITVNQTEQIIDVQDAFGGFRRVFIDTTDATSEIMISIDSPVSSAKNIIYISSGLTFDEEIKGDKIYIKCASGSNDVNYTLYKDDHTNQNSLVGANKVTANQTEQVITIDEGFGAFRKICIDATQATSEIAISIDESFSTTNRIIYIKAASLFEQFITGKKIFYKCTTGTNTLNYVLL